MIDPKSRTLEWILESCKINKVSDPTLMEKTIRAFSLLEALAKSSCPFLFKGGSALMLKNTVSEKSNPPTGSPAPTFQRRTPNASTKSPTSPIPQRKRFCWTSCLRIIGIPT